MISIDGQGSLDVRDEASLLTRTLVGTFESEAHARSAAALLQSLSHLDLLASKIIVPLVTLNDEVEAVRRILGDGNWEDVGRALRDGYAILIATVDEACAVLARDVLDSDAQSLRTLMLSPEPRDQ